MVVTAVSLIGCDKIQRKTEASQFPINMVCEETVDDIPGPPFVIVLDKNEAGVFVRRSKESYGNDTHITNRFGPCESKNIKLCDYKTTHVNLSDDELTYGYVEHWGTQWFEKSDNDIVFNVVVNRISGQVHLSGSAGGKPILGYGTCKVVKKKF